MSQVTIYALRDPDTGAIRYIGKADNADARFKSHLRDAKRRSTLVYVWIRSLVKQGKSPRMDVLRIIDRSVWEEAERELIAQYRQHGDLLNVARGGNQPGQASYETLAANARKTTAARETDPFQKRLWEIKRDMANGIRWMEKNGRTEALARVRAKLRIAAAKRPDLFGEYA